MSICDKCIAPGACCMAMHLNGEDGPMTFWDDHSPVEQIIKRNHTLWSFYPKERIEQTTVPDDDETDAGRTYSSYVWGCSALNKHTGRCERYEDRPQLCRDYEPASGDGLCVYSRPLENGEESAL